MDEYIERILLTNDDELNENEQETKKILMHPTITRMLSRMPEGLNDLEKARYVYINLGKIFTLDTDYCLGNSKSKAKLRRYVSTNKVNLDELKIKRNRYKGVCHNISIIYGHIMSAMGTRCLLLQDDNRADPHSYIELWIDKEKNNIRFDDTAVSYAINSENSFKDSKYLKVLADIQADLKNIQTHQHTRYFGCDYEGLEITVPDDEIEKMDKKIGYEYDGELAFEKMFRDFKIETKDLRGVELVEAFFRAIERTPYINDLGIFERKKVISALKNEMLPRQEKANLFTSYIYKRNPNDRTYRKGFIPIYTYIEGGKPRKFHRYYYDKYERVHREISDMELYEFMHKNNYCAVKEIPGLEGNVKRIKLAKLNKNKKDIEDR